MAIKKVLFGERLRNKAYIARLFASFFFQWFGVTTVVIIWSALGFYSPWYYQLNVPAIAALAKALSIVAWFDVILSNTALLVPFQLLFLSMLAGVLFMEEPYQNLNWIYDGWHIYRVGNVIWISTPPDVARQTGYKQIDIDLPRYLCGQDPHFIDTMIYGDWINQTFNQVDFPKVLRPSISSFIQETQHWI